MAYLVQHKCDDKLEEVEFGEFALVKIGDGHGAVAMCAYCKERLVVLEPDVFERARHARGTELQGEYGFVVPGHKA